MPKPTDERIAAAMGEGARVADINVLIADLRTEAVGDEAEACRLETLSVAVDTPEPDADAASDRAAKCRRRVQRLGAKISVLEGRLADLEQSNRRRAALADRAAVEERRDQLADDIRRDWPELTARIVALLERIKASDKECERVGSLLSAEAVARGCPGNFCVTFGNSRLGSQNVLRLVDMRLPQLNASTSTAAAKMAWGWS